MRDISRLSIKDGQLTVQHRNSTMGVNRRTHTTGTAPHAGALADALLGLRRYVVDLMGINEPEHGVAAAWCDTLTICALTLGEDKKGRTAIISAKRPAPHTNGPAVFNTPLCHLGGDGVWETGFREKVEVVAVAADAWVESLPPEAHQESIDFGAPAEEGDEEGEQPDAGAGPGAPVAIGGKWGCPVAACAKAFDTEAGAKRHITRKHKGETFDTEPRPGAMDITPGLNRTDEEQATVDERIAADARAEEAADGEEPGTYYPTVEDGQSEPEPDLPPDIQAENEDAEIERGEEPLAADAGERQEGEWYECVECGDAIEGRKAFDQHQRTHAHPEVPEHAGEAVSA